MLKSELERSILEGDETVKVKTLIENLRAIYRNILKINALLEKTPDLTLETLKERQLYLQEQTERAQAIKGHLDVIVPPDSPLRTLEYFADNKWDSFVTMADGVELALITRSNFLHSVRQRMSMSTSTPTNSPGRSRTNDTPGQYLRLPKLELPTFDGTLSDWQNFYDLFKATVDSHGALSSATKMQYLKAAVTGEAAKLLSVLPVTDDNYQVALNALKTRYENKRALITHHLHNITNIQPVGNDALSKLRTLRDTLNVSVESLKLLRVQADTWGPILIHIVTQKMSPVIQKEWEKSLAGVNEYPDLQRFNTFLNEQVRILENLELNREGDPRQVQITKHKAAHNTAIKDSNKKCTYCNQAHPIFQCEDFKALSIKERYNAQRAKGLCSNCLYPKHTKNDCRSKGSCRLCSEKHHTLLHYDKVPAKSSHVVNNELLEEDTEDPPLDLADEDEEEETVEDIEPPHLTGMHTMPEHTEVLLATALVRVHSPLGATVVARALIDGGAETSFVSESLVQTLRLPKTKAKIIITGLQGTTTGTIKHSTCLQISSLHDDLSRYEMSAYVLQHITNYKPKKFTPKDYTELKNLKLADPEPSSKLRIDLLLGADILGQLMQAGLLHLRQSQVTARATSLGWILSGPTVETKHAHQITVNHASCDVPSLLQRFWEIEEFTEPKPASREDEQCEKFFNDTTTRDESGRFCVRLPFKSDEERLSLGESKSIAVASWGSVSRRLNKLPERRATYDEFMKEYEALKHMEEIPRDSPELEKCTFVPHHDVVRPDHLTTQVRVVFNASSKTRSGVSLNDVLCAGPKLQNDIADVVTNWRRHPYVLKADITKMFRQILVHKDDTPYQCIVYSDPLSNEIKFYKLLTVTYGTRPAPYLANRVIKEVVKQHGSEFPLAIEPLEKCIYVDDAFLGADSKAEAKEIQSQVDQLLKKACLELRKWSANSEDLLPDASTSTSEFFIEPTGDDKKTVLGIAWSPQRDEFSIKVQPIQVEAPTKRIILSNTARLYDPLGWLAPFVIRPKLLMQALWLAKRDWDDTNLPEEVLEAWKSICDELPVLSTISIPRFIGSGAQPATVKLIGFSDASKTAYAAAVYLMVEYATGETKFNLLQAKSRVAPVKTVSIPRLELCGAVLLAKLISHVRDSWLGNIDETTCFTDSRIVLDWLARHASKWHTFVANRVSFIQTTIPDVSWQHIPGKFNPADLPSRGLKAQDLVDSQLWWHGPNISAIEKENPGEEKLAEEAIEVAREACHTVTVHQQVVSQLPKYLTQCSNWMRLSRAIGYCMKYLDILRERITSQPRGQGPHPLLSTYERRGVLQVENVPWRNQILSIDQLVRGENHIYRVQQETAFSGEIAALKRGHPVSKGSPLHQLCPFLDADNVMRASTRMQYAALPWTQRNPIILPKDRVTAVLIRYHHLDTKHSEMQLTLTRLRELYWILHARTQVKSVISRCAICARYTAPPQTQLMASPPPERVNESAFPFQHTGVDYAGHFMMKHASGRGHQAHKVWVAVFVCFATRAVHLEIVDDYSSQAFLYAFNCFVARRGLPSSLWMDQGTSVRGACAGIARVYRSLINNPEWLNHLNMHRIEFHTTPPKAPHHGGIWEAAVKAFKYHFYRILGDFTPSWDEMHTILCQIEACLNSRPITPTLDVATEEPALTSGHFLMGRSPKALPQRNYLEKRTTLLERWQVCSQIVQTFWKRWRNESLYKYYPRYKWREQAENLKVGDIVLVMDEDFPPCDWGLAVITATKPGRDGLVREVTVRTKNTELVRPITKLCKLPTDQTET